MQNAFLKPMNIFSMKKIFSLLQTAPTITSENIIQIEDLRKTQLFAIHYDCSKKFNLTQFS